MRVVVVTSWSSEKLVKPEGLVTLAEFHSDRDRLQAREAESKQFLTPASEHYARDQRVRLMRDGLSI